MSRADTLPPDEPPTSPTLAIPAGSAQAVVLAAFANLVAAVLEAEKVAMACARAADLPSNT